ncbi:MAG: 4-alpha-glucanotransferase [Chloroflexota bacterium]
MQTYEELIEDLAILAGVIPEYWDISGTRRGAPLHAKRDILRAMRFTVDSAEDVQSEISRLRWRSWRGFLDPVHVISAVETPVTVPVYLPLSARHIARVTLAWTVQFEDGRHKRGLISGDRIVPAQEECIDGTCYTRVDLQIPLPPELGYHRLSVECHDPRRGLPGKASLLTKTARLIVAPDQCYVPQSLQNGRRWGLYCNLYAIRSSRNWGVGDFSDLSQTAGWVASLEGSLVGINPLHATPNSQRVAVSPYYPVSRLYKNFLYLDIEQIPELRGARQVRTKSIKEQIVKLKSERLINYDGVAALKRELIEKAFALFHEKHYRRNTSRARSFRKFIADEGDALSSFALFMALSEHLVEKNGTPSWQQWPVEYRRPDSPAVSKFKKAHTREILFHCYAQWLIEEALSVLCQEAQRVGLDVGLYHDLAIGSITGGSDVWNHQDLFGDAEVGAPPDDFSPQGQNWGFPPMIPDSMKNSGYELFIQTLRKSMRHFGALRIDHALGLFRLFWVPRGTPATEGVYVKCPWDDLRRIIALESVRNKTMVIAEDLGTIGDNVREELARCDMLSYRLLYFERNYPDPALTEPARYPEKALCAVTTHDLPTLYGYWLGADLKAKEELGMFDHEERHEQLRVRERDKALILAALAAQGFLPEGSSPEEMLKTGMTPRLCLAIYRYLAETPCKLLLVSLDDIIGTLNQQNMPGIVDHYPNWRQKTPLALEEVIADGRFSELARMLKAARPSDAGS